MIRALGGLALALPCLFAPTMLAAETWPGLYGVVGVEADDVLNIRSAPSQSAPIVGALEPDAAGVEVVEPSPDMLWGRVNTGEGSGWASLAFLERQDASPDHQPLTRAQCFGTEPFWSLAIDEQDATFDTPDAMPLGFVLGNRFASRNRPGHHAGVYENNLGGLITTMQNTSCNDGMSDRAYGWQVDVILVVAGDANAQLFTGCCSIVPPE